MQFSQVISIAGYSIEAFGVLVVVVGSLISSVSFARTFRYLPESAAYRTYRQRLHHLSLEGGENVAPAAEFASTRAAVTAIWRETME